MSWALWQNLKEKQKKSKPNKTVVKLNLQKNQISSNAIRLWIAKVT